VGMFDTIMVPCPRCGKKCEAQSKSGSCLLDVFEMKDAPQEVLADVNCQAPFHCECGAIFKVSLHMIPVATLISVDDFDKKQQGVGEENG